MIFSPRGVMAAIMVCEWERLSSSNRECSLHDSARCVIIAACRRGLAGRAIHPETTAFTCSKRLNPKYVPYKRMLPWD